MKKNKALKREYFNSVVQTIMSDFHGEKLTAKLQKDLKLELSEAFDLIKEDGYIIPSLNNTEMSIIRSGSGFQISTTVKIDYGVALVPLVKTVEVPYIFNYEQPKEITVQEMVERIDGVWSDIISVIKGTIAPTTTILKYGYNSNTCKSRRCRTIIKEALAIAKEINVELIESAKTKIKEDYTTKLNATTAPDGFAPMNLEDVDFEIELKNGTLCQFEVSMTFGKNILTKELDFDCYKILGYADRDKTFNEFSNAFRAKIIELSKIGETLIPSYYASRIKKVPSIPEGLATLLQDGSVQIGTLFLKGEKLSRYGKVYYNEEDGAPKLYFSPECITKETFGIPFDISQIRDHTSVTEFGMMPKNLIGLYQLCTVVAEDSQKYAEEKGGHPIPIIVKVSSCQFASFEIGSYVIQNFNYTPSDIVNLIHERIDRTCNMKGDQLNLLNSMNPAELAIYKQAYDDGYCWAGLIEKQIGRDLPTDRSFISDCLAKLSRTRIFANSSNGVQEVALLEAEWTKSHDHYGHFWLFRVKYKLEPDVLKEATGRPFHKEELPLLKEAEKAEWFIEALINTETSEERWNAFAEVQENVPQARLVRFAKSEEGKSILMKFEGEEAVFVKMIIQGLPGCKRLANELFPDADI